MNIKSLKITINYIKHQNKKNNNKKKTIIIDDDQI